MNFPYAHARQQQQQATMRPALQQQQQNLNMQMQQAQGQQQTQASEQQGQSTAGQAEGAKDFASLYGNIWDNPKQQAQSSQQQATTQQQQQAAPQQQNLASSFDQRVAGFNFAQASLNQEQQAAMQQAFQAGDMNGFMQAFNPALNSMMQQVYRQAIMDSGTLAEAAVNRAVDQSKNWTTQAYATDKARNQMHTRLPWTADPALGPVAESVLQRVMGQGKSLDQAIEAVDAFFNHADGVRGNKRNSQGNSVDDESIDWVKNLMG